MNYTDSYFSALAYAAAARKLQRRRGSYVPYISHLFGVTAIVLDVVGDEIGAIAAFLQQGTNRALWRRVNADAPTRADAGSKTGRIGRGRRALLVPMMIVAVLGSFVGGSPGLAQSVDEARFAGLEPESRAVYDADACDKQKQTWSDYFNHWLHDFYLGGSGQAGWFESERQLVAEINMAAQSSVLMQLDALGVRVGGEWAKDNSCRKIRSTAAFPQSFLEPDKPALDQMASKLLAASKSDVGDGVNLSHAIDDISKQLDAVLPR